MMQDHGCVPRPFRVFDDVRYPEMKRFALPTAPVTLAEERS
jgi:hypothetical protein